MMMTEEREVRMKTVLDRIPESWGKYLPGPGWDDILLELDRDIATLDPNYVVLQAKQKFNALRYYVQLSDGLSRESAYVIQNWIIEAEQKARITDEVTGAPKIWGT